MLYFSLSRVHISEYDRGVSGRTEHTEVLKHSFTAIARRQEKAEDYNRMYVIGRFKLIFIPCLSFIQIKSLATKISESWRHCI